MSADTTPERSSAPSRGRRLYRLIAPPAVFVVVYYAILVYPALRILGLVLPDWQPGTLALALLMAGPAATRLLCERLPGRAARPVAALVMTWLGISFIGFCLVLPWELVNLLTSVVADRPLPAQASGIALLGGVLAISAAGVVNAQMVRLRPIEVPAPAAVRGLTFAQLTDVHVGSRSGRFLARVVRAANRAGADYVLITGDLVDFRNIGADVLAPLGELEAPAFFVIGNHERYVDCEAICRRLEALGITVLRNRSMTLEPSRSGDRSHRSGMTLEPSRSGDRSHGRVQLVGIDDAEPRSQVSRVLEHLEPVPEAYRILLYHRPTGVADAARWGVHLMLCGHTHNGQIVPFNQVVRRVFPYIHGLYRVDDLQLYVSPGTGTWGPVLRLGSRSEVTVVRLV